MSQNWTDDLYAQSTVADTCFSNMENNFAALKSSFGGSSAPSNPLAGQFWFDTSANILKLRNEANNAWLNLYDFGNQQVYDAKTLSDINIIAGSGMTGGGLLSANRTITHGSHTGDVTGSVDLTLAADVVSTANMDPGMGGFLPQNLHGGMPWGQATEAGSGPWADMSGWTGGNWWWIYVPANAVTLGFRAEARYVWASGYSYRFRIGSTYSTSTTVPNIGWEWKAEVFMNLSALSGWQQLYIQGIRIYMRDFAFWWA